jgi:peptidoglycan hydrolase-like protein with peptidoglycan-binding domain
LWAGTNHYSRGKFVADGQYDPNHVDTQLGIIPVLYEMVQIDPETYIGDGSPVAPGPTPSQPDPEIAPYTPAEVMYIQGSMNILMPGDENLLRPDGNYGRLTARTVKNFQRRHPPLEVDGDAGPLTLEVIKQELAKIGPIA